jgi:hypothetical protein|eukprot:COSAG06_NODE_48_length_29046_cov_7.967181_2_plen_88_part_00
MCQAVDLTDLMICFTGSSLLGWLAGWRAWRALTTTGIAADENRHVQVGSITFLHKVLIRCEAVADLCIHASEQSGQRVATTTAISCR